MMCKSGKPPTEVIFIRLTKDAIIKTWTLFAASFQRSNKQLDRFQFKVLMKAYAISSHLGVDYVVSLCKESTIEVLEFIPGTPSYDFASKASLRASPSTSSGNKTSDSKLDPGFLHKEYESCPVEPKSSQISSKSNPFESQRSFATDTQEEDPVKAKQTAIISYFADCLQQGKPCDRDIMKNFVLTLKRNESNSKLVHDRSLGSLIYPLETYSAGLSNRMKSTFKNFSADGKTAVFTPVSSLP